ncbi:hypothetical protein GUITHDRAFT_119913 [Guillardia theta CCMP2712]|uniref:Uncharacterized protein n=1 Tax=Guillardia theta (strain CCMP2712) TaxID=905079 RepID=L1ICR8_GUITC|nr:hypothetical protein GUITHDRAFT_119913 [Guillardia theta CCMP2712]EKX33867.1 hypothetical protein GUITHDRAFT_119913 [Guillardia theta CCMP2712]|eukprot:XP_005820847.1 hypothetical protein GUITHDRAFT_119913 [Guillardia theta CCMP2712]
MATALLGSFSQKAIPNFCPRGVTSEPANALSKFLDSKNIEMFLEEEGEDSFMGCMIEPSGYSLHASGRKYQAGKYEYRDLHADTIADMQTAATNRMSILSILDNDLSRSKTCNSFNLKAKKFAMSEQKFMEGVAVVVVDGDSVMLEEEPGDGFLRLPSMRFEQFCDESDAGKLEQGAGQLLPSKGLTGGQVHVDMQTGVFVDTEMVDGVMKHLHKRTFSRVFVVRGSAGDVKVGKHMRELLVMFHVSDALLGLVL